VSFGDSCFSGGVVGLMWLMAEAEAEAEIEEILKRHSPIEIHTS
jgi:hypothetical protein